MVEYNAGAVLRRAATGTETGTATDPLAVGGAMVSKLVEVTRPSDTTAYAAKDAVDATVAAGFVFTSIARVSGGSGYIVKAQLLTDQKTCIARFRLHLFNAAPTYIADNSPYLQLYANAASRVGTIDFDACTTEDPTNSTAAGSQNTSVRLSFVCAADANLYGILETLDAFTPASGQKISIKLGVDQN